MVLHISGNITQLEGDLLVGDKVLDRVPRVGWNIALPSLVSKREVFICCL